MSQKYPLIGAHFSIAGGLQNALYQARSYGCTALQMFTKNARTWKETMPDRDEIARFEKARTETGITEIAAHTSYLINVATPDKAKRERSFEALKQELIRASVLAIPYVVLHPGAHMGKGEDAGIRRIADTIRSLSDGISDLRTRLLLETTAGQGSGIGHTFEQLAAIMEQVGAPDHMGVCLDTCHIFAAGYDIRTEKAYARTMRLFDEIIGLKHLYVIHLNDAKKALGSRVDRHEHIGAGEIGIRAFELIMNDPRLAHISKIIETPKGKGREDWDRINLERLRALLGMTP